MTAKARDFILPISILVLATILITVTNADLKLSALFCVGGKWPVGYLQPWQALYKLDRIPSFFIGFIGLLAVLSGYMYQSRRHWIKPGLFLIILLLLGPGLIINSIFKEYWGRPRPREIVQFAGKKEFLHPWQKGVAHNGRSFPSGHSSAAFYISAPFFVYRRREPRVAAWWMAGGLVFGTLMSVARITQGGHFLSDTLWAWGVVHLTAVSLYYLMRLDQVDSPLVTK